VMRQPQGGTAAPRARRSWIVEAWALFRQTIKEGRKTWFLLAAISLAIPLILYVYADSVLDRSLLVTYASLIVTAAGASVFGLENRSRTQRFLVHHGARPGSVWLVKVTTWALGLAVIAVISGCVVIFMHTQGQPTETIVVPILCFPLAYAVAVICGMALRRGITAFVIAVVVTILSAGILIGLTVETILPAAAILVVAAALLAISWAWRRDWMLERPAPGRWLRLGLYFAVTFAVLFACHVGIRVWSVPEFGPVAPPAAWAEAASTEIAPDRNAAGLYNEAGRRLIGDDSNAYLTRNKVAIDLIRRAAALPDCRFEAPERRTLINQARPPLLPFARLISLDADDRLSRGDLAGSWDDVTVLFRMAAHFTEGSAVDTARLALIAAEREGLRLALDWAIAPGQTPERLRAALDAYRNLPKMPPASDVVRAEANLVENTLNLPADKLRGYLEELVYGPRRPDQTVHARQLLRLGMIDVVTTPWELARARRVNRALAAREIETGSREPGHRIDKDWQQQTYGHHWQNVPDRLRALLQSAGIYVFADDQNEVARRALVQIIAIRIWQLKHDGRFPDRLEALVPDELPSLPLDPYADRTFGYIPWEAGSVLAMQSALLAPVFVGAGTEFISPKPGSWLLYSVGHDRQDDGGTSNSKTFPGRDLVFVIPPIAKTAGTPKDKAESAPKDRPSEAAKPK
jgi:hypothetical protein